MWNQIKQLLLLNFRPKYDYKFSPKMILIQLHLEK